jgi:hypothetical protein
VASVIRRTAEKKIEDVLGEDQFGFRKGTRDVIGLLRIISERTLDRNLCLLRRLAESILPCKVDKIDGILKKIGIDWRDRRLISKFSMDQSVKVGLDQGVTKSVKIGRGVRQGRCLSSLLFNLYSEYVTQEAPEGLGDFRVGGKIISTVRYADDLVLLA